MGNRINKALIVGGNTIVTQAAWNAELDAKHEKLIEWMKAQGLSGILIRRNENVAWLTGGAVELRVLTPRRNRRSRAAGHCGRQALLLHHRE